MRKYMLRASNVRAFPGQPDPDLALDNDPDALDLWVRKSGSKTAAWLVWKSKKKFLKHGTVRYELPPEVKTPPYFRVAMATLRGRGKWKVDCVRTTRKTTYTVTWLAWGTNRARRSLLA